MKVSDNNADAFDNPMPPMQPNMDMQGDMGSDLMGGQDDMPDDLGDTSSNSEIDDIFSKLDTEKQAAVIKYAKSMVNNEPEDKNMDEELVTEITNDILGDMDNKVEDEEDTKVRNKQITSDNPFIHKSHCKK